MTVRIAHGELVGLLRAMFARHGCSDRVAALLAQNMADTERDGAHSHGIFRVNALLASLESGWVDGRAEPVLEDVAPGMLRADGRNGFALRVLDLAAEPLMAKARHNGIAVLTIRNAHHFSAVWPDIEPLARQGFVALAMINSMVSVVPHGGQRKVFGTNPLGFAAPRVGREPLVFDQASSAMANGDVQLARREGRQLPPGTGVDRFGEPTTDPAAVLEGGALLPFGGHKGSSIAMMIEVMGAALAGGDFSFEVDLSKHPGAATPNGGQTYIVIDPDRGAVNSFTARLELLIAQMHAAGQDRLPGDRRYATRQDSIANGISVDRTALEEIVRRMS